MLIQMTSNNFWWLGVSMRHSTLTALAKKYVVNFDVRWVLDPWWHFPVFYLGRALNLKILIGKDYWHSATGRHFFICCNKDKPDLQQCCTQMHLSFFGTNCKFSEGLFDNLPPLFYKTHHAWPLTAGALWAIMQETVYHLSTKSVYWSIDVN